MAKAGRSGRIATVLGHLKPRRRARPQFVNRTRLSIPTFLGSRAADKVLLLRHFKAALDRIANPETPREQRVMLLRERRLTLSEIKFLPGEGLEPQVVKGRGRRSLTGLDAATALDLLKQVKDGELKRGQIKRAIKAKLI